MRPVLSLASRRLWRDQETLQIGHAPAGAVVLAGLDPATRSVLALLDGTRDLAQVLRAAEDTGCPAERTHQLLALLGTAGLLTDGGDRWPPGFQVGDRDRLASDVAALSLLHRGHGLPALGRRDTSAVTVLGAGRVGAATAALLASAGLGSVDVVDDGTARPQDAAPGGLALDDIGRRRGVAARDRLGRCAPTTRLGPVQRPDLVLLTPTDGVDSRDIGALERARTPYLLAEVRDCVGVVGPLVVPGRSACLQCIDLDRTERDPEWPTLAAQLAAPGRSDPACNGVLAAAVAAQAALQSLAFLDGELPASLNGTLELALPDYRWRRRTRVRHPGCQCHWQATG